MGIADSPLKHRMAFLVGVRRSGTNWLRRIVDAHPDAAVVPSETYLLTHGIAPLVGRVQHGVAGSARTATMYVPRDRFYDAARDLCDELLLSHLETLDHPVKVLGERTPDHVRALHLVRGVYPDAAVIHIIRDGRDVARSLVSQAWGPTDHRQAAREWVSGIEAARAVGPTLDRYLELRYEQLLADPVRQVPALYRFLDLDDSPEVVERALTEADVPYNVDPAATEISANKWQGGLGGDELDDVIAVAGDLLDELGYATDGAASPPARRGRALADTLRSLSLRLRGVGASIDARRRRSGDGAAFQRQVLDSFESTMTLLDELLDDVTAGRFHSLQRHFSEQARIRVLASDEAWDERGPDAVRRLGEVLAADPALAGRQLRGDVHPGVPAFTVVSAWEAVDGSVHDRVLVLGRFGAHIDDLTWYQLPRLSPARP